MPTAPPRVCVRCHRLVRGRCARCSVARDRARGSAAARGYDAQWAVYSKRWLAAYPLCGMRLDGQRHRDHSHCTRRGERTRATVTDHIRSLRDGGAQYDPTNHQSLCTSCNTAKDARRGPRL